MKVLILGLIGILFVVCYDSILLFCSGSCGLLGLCFLCLGWCLCATCLLNINKILFNEEKKKVRICIDTVSLFIYNRICNIIRSRIFFTYNRICIDTKFEIQECLKYKSTVKYKGIWKGNNFILSYRNPRVVRICILYSMLSLDRSRILCYHLQVVSSLLSYPLIVALVLLKHQEF